LGITPFDNRYAYEVLRQNGNMSSATVLFVLKEVWNARKNPDLTEEVQQNNRPANILSCAFGPGLTLEAMVLEAVTAEPDYATTVRSSALAQAS